MSYEHILVAIDVHEGARQVIQKAAAIADSSQAQITLVHVCDPPVTGYGEYMGHNLVVTEAQIKQNVYPTIHKLALEFNIPEDRIHILFGHPATEIHQLAEDLGCSLVVVGSHGKHGIRLLLGSTANSVIHGAKCDVLAVRLQEED